MVQVHGSSDHEATCVMTQSWCGRAGGIDGPARVMALWSCRPHPPTSTSTLLFLQENLCDCHVSFSVCRRNEGSYGDQPHMGGYRRHWVFKQTYCPPPPPPPPAPFAAGNDVYQQTSPTTVIAALGVLANDELQGCTELSVTVVVDPEHGTVALNNDGSFTYTPEDPNFPILDEFIYRLTCLTTGQQAFASVTLQDPSGRCLWVQRQGVVLLPLCVWALKGCC